MQSDLLSVDKSCAIPPEVLVGSVRSSASVVCIGHGSAVSLFAGWPDEGDYAFLRLAALSLDCLDVRRSGSNLWFIRSSSVKE